MKNTHEVEKKLYCIDISLCFNLQTFVKRANTSFQFVRSSSARSWPLSRSRSSKNVSRSKTRNTFFNFHFTFSQTFYIIIMLPWKLNRTLRGNTSNEYIFFSVDVRQRWGWNNHHQRIGNCNAVPRWVSWK